MTKSLLRTRLPEVLGAVTWCHRGLFPIGLARWKAQIVTPSARRVTRGHTVQGKKAEIAYFPNLHGRARLSHTGLELRDRHVSQVGQKK